MNADTSQDGKRKLKLLLPPFGVVNLGPGLLSVAGSLGCSGVGLGGFTFFLVSFGFLCFSPSFGIISNSCSVSTVLLKKGGATT